VVLARHLNARDVESIVSLIQGWSDTKLTWDAICEAAESLVGKKPTRQSLNSHEEIVSAYKVVKKGLKEAGPKNPRPSSLKSAADRIAKLERERDQVKEENRRYKQQFVLWQYNAYKYGMKEYQLNEPLPSIDRERTDGEKR
jgi:hypothetical protein